MTLFLLCQKIKAIARFSHYRECGTPHFLSRAYYRFSRLWFDLKHYWSLCHCHVKLHLQQMQSNRSSVWQIHSPNRSNKIINRGVLFKLSFPGPTAYHFLKHSLKPKLNIHHIQVIAINVAVHEEYHGCPPCIVCFLLFSNCG